MSETLVQLEGVSKRFPGPRGPIAAIDDMDVQIRSHRVTAVVGPDGAGKTTLMRIVMGLLCPDEGCVQVLGHDSVQEPERFRKDVGYMPQNGGLYEELTVDENLRLYADLRELSRHEREDRFESLLGLTGLAPFRKRLAGKLSGGMRQKLGLACALVRAPRLLLLDEPTAGVDPLSRRELWETVQGLVDEGMGVLWSTAYLDEAERSGAVVVLDKGRVVYRGDPGEFTSRARGRCFTLRAPRSNLRVLQRRALRMDGVADAVRRSDAIRFLMDSDEERPRLHDLLDSEDEREAARIESADPRFEDAYVGALRSSRGRAFATEEGSAPTGEERTQVEKAKPIEARALVRRFGDFTAVGGVSFAVESGEIFGLLGPNGAGKSTIFKMLCGLLPPSAGEARVAGIDLRRSAARARGRIGYMAQHFSLYAELSVAQNLHFFSRAYGLRGRRGRERRDWAAREFDLKSYSGTLSGALPLGYKQRLSLACALMHEPEILFLDEPTSGVDPLTRREFWTRINALAERGVSVLVTTHFMEEAEHCDRLAIVYQGQIIATGKPAELRRKEQVPGKSAPSIEEVFISLIERRQNGNLV